MNWHEQLMTPLSDHGLAVIENFLSPEDLAATNTDFDHHLMMGRFRRAKIGQASQQRIENEVRKDAVCWFDNECLSPAQQILWQRLSGMKDVLNERFFLGLWELEAHYALYSAGGFYKRHLDRFQADDARTLTLVLYLNSNWRPGDGGELLAYQGSSLEPMAEIQPLGGTLVAFLSDQIEHEVKTSNKERRSVAGWFKRRTRP